MNPRSINTSRRSITTNINQQLSRTALRHIIRHRDSQASTRTPYKLSPKVKNNSTNTISQTKARHNTTTPTKRHNTIQFRTVRHINMNTTSPILPPSKLIKRRTRDNRNIRSHPNHTKRLTQQVSILSPRRPNTQALTHTRPTTSHNRRQTRIRHTHKQQHRTTTMRTLIVTFGRHLATGPSTT